MKFIIALTFVIMSVNALSQIDADEIDFKNERLVGEYVKKAIADVSQSIKDAGMDPLYIKNEERNYTLPVPVIFNSAYLIEELLVNGLSNIVVNSASYNIITSRLKFDIELPLINGSLGRASTETTLFGKTFKINSSGKVEIQRLRFVGQVRISIGITNGVTVTSTKVTFTMAGIESDMKLVVQDKDYSDKLNEFLHSTVPATFKEYSSEINELLEILLKDFINKNLKQK